MMKLIKAFVLSLIMLFNITVANAQKKSRFSDDVQTIKNYDKIYAPPKDAILFTGSSSVRKWDVVDAFKKYTVLNRAIGGAVIADLDNHVDDLIVPYQPKQIVLYIGDNDLKAAANGDSIFVAFKKLYQHIRMKLPETPIVYVSIKPSPSREAYMPTAVRANLLTDEFLKTEKNVVYVDVYKPMLNKDGHTRPELFVQDMLHLNTEGYKLWYKLIKPFLLKN